MISRAQEHICSRVSAGVNVKIVTFSDLTPKKRPDTQE
jgi:hypothetical protein